jgi:hypothetical protein
MPLILLTLDVASITLVAPTEHRELRHVLRDAGWFAPHIAILFTYTVVRDEKSIVRWAMAVWAVGVLASMHAIVMRILDIESLSLFQGQLEVGTAFGTYSRAYGLPGSIFFAMYGAIIGLGLLAQPQRSWPLVARWAMALGTGICGIQVVLFAARSYWIGAIAAFVPIFMTFSTRQKVRTTLVALCAGGLLLLCADLAPGGPIQQLATRFASIFSGRGGGELARDTKAGRASELEQVLRELAGADLWTGRGLGAHYAVFVPGGESVVVYHNGVATVLLKVGVLGLAIWVWFVINLALAAISLRTKPCPPQIKGLAVGLTGTYVAAAGYAVGAFGPPMMPTLLEGMVLGLGLRALSIANGPKVSSMQAAFQPSGPPASSSALAAFTGARL